MEGIICTQAWACGDKDCRAQWHQRNFWAYSDGSYGVDEYSDGDHEDCEESDIPSQAEIEASWREYAQHVAATGEDPLGTYFVLRERAERQIWQFRFRNSIVGPVLQCAKRGGKVYCSTELPQHVRDYLTLHRDGRRIAGYASWDEFCEAVPNVKQGQWLRQTIEHRTTRNPATIARELRASAARDLRGKGD